MFSAAEALTLGLVNDVVPVADLRARTDEMVARLNEKSLPVLRGIKAAWRLAQSVSLQEGLRREQSEAEGLIHRGAGGDGTGEIARA
jgi:enoyl-CoA hydratase/carnithine racemase